MAHCQGGYCTYCYQNGAFTEPDLTREDAVSRSAPLMASPRDAIREGRGDGPAVPFDTARMANQPVARPCCE
ncbi:MAG: zinc ribbon domain-containing protein [Methanomicrobiales archaeon]